MDLPLEPGWQTQGLLHPIGIRLQLILEPTIRVMVDILIELQAAINIFMFLIRNFMMSLALESWQTQ